MHACKTFILSALSCAVIVLGGGSGAADVAPSKGFVEAESGRLYYEVRGVGSPVVLVSGGSGLDLRQWDALADALVPEYRVVAWDPRGIGRSDNPTARYSDAQDLLRLLDHLDIDKAILAGSSSAGGFVLEFALQHPERTRAVVGVSPFVPGFQFSEPMLKRLREITEAGNRGREPYLDRMFGDPHFIPAPLNPSVRTMARENMGRNYDKGADVDPALAVVLDPPLIERLTEIAVPTLLVVGELDHPEVLRRNHFLVEQIPGSEERTVSSSGHNVPVENPKALLEAVRPFLLRLASD